MTEEQEREVCRHIDNVDYLLDGGTIDIDTHYHLKRRLGELCLSVDRMFFRTLEK